MSEAVSAEDLAELLSEGLDLCVRARKLDEAVTQAAAVGDMSSQGGTKCLTPALWVQDQYDRDLSAWEDRARGRLSTWLFGRRALCPSEREG